MTAVFTSNLEQEFTLLSVAPIELDCAGALFCAHLEKNEAAQQEASKKLYDYLKSRGNRDSDLYLFLSQLYDTLKPQSEMPIRNGGFFSFFSSSSAQKPLAPSRLWESIATFFTTQTFEDLQAILPCLEKEIDERCHRLVCTLLIAPPKSIVSNCKIDEFLEKLFVRQFACVDSSFWINEVFKEGACTSAFKVFLSFLHSKYVQSPEQSQVRQCFRETLCRRIQPIHTPEMLLVVVEEVLREVAKGDVMHPDLMSIFNEELRKKVEQFDGQSQDIVRKLHYINLFGVLPLATHGLKCQDLAIQSIFMANHVAGECGIVKKSGAIARSIIIDPNPIDQQASLYVLSKRKGGVLQAAGNFKRVTQALRFFRDDCKAVVPRFAAQSINIYKDPIKKTALDQAQILINYDLACREKMFGIKLQGVIGTVQLQSHLLYKKQVEPVGDVSVMSLMWDYYEMDLSLAIKNQLLEDNSRKKVIAKDLLTGLQGIHAKGLIHWDIKLANMVCRKEESVYRAALCDFGFMFHIDEASERIQRYHTGCFYGSFAYTAPELLNSTNLPRSGLVGFLQSAEVWACGLALYKLYYARLGIEGKAPWESKLETIIKQNSKVLTKAVKTQMHRELIESYGALEKPDNSFLQLIHEMLQPDLNIRPKLQHCLDRLSAMTNVDQSFY